MRCAASMAVSSACAMLVPVVLVRVDYSVKGRRQKTEDRRQNTEGSRQGRLQLEMHARQATPEDAADIARIYNQGIADRTATFETRPRTQSDIHAWSDGAHPVLVVEEQGAVVAFAATFEYRPRACYAAIAETSVYVDRAFRRHGAGHLALKALIAAAAAAGFRKLVSRI